MRAIIVDDESYCADYLEGLCEDIQGLRIIGKFENAMEARDFLSNNRVELAFLDIEMPGLSGIQAVEALREVCPGLAIIFVTGYENYAMDAFKLDAVSYLLKPCDSSELAHAIEKAARLIPLTSKRLQVRTFGHFAVYIDGEPFRFSNRKAKELMALLVNQQGGVVTMEQAVCTLWEDRPYDNTVKQLYRKAVIYLNQISSQKNLNFFVSNRGSCHIIPSAMLCDYFELLAGNPKAREYFNGEYMMDYSWGEETLAGLQYRFMSPYDQA